MRNDQLSLSSVAREDRKGYTNEARTRFLADSPESLGVMRAPETLPRVLQAFTG